MENVDFVISIIDKFLNKTRKEYDFRMKRFI